MKKLNQLLFTLLIVATYQAQGCSCSWGGGFLRVSKYQKLIVLVKVESYVTQLKYDRARNENRQDTLAMEVEILKVIKGKIAKDRIRVFGDNGYLCRPYIESHRFEQGKQYVLNLIESTTGKFSAKGEETGDYFISICSENWLPYDPRTALVYGIVNRNRFRARRKYFNLDKILARIEKS